MQRAWYRSLAARHGLVMLAFVALGSLLLLGWLRARQADEAQRLFLSVTQNDTDFVRRLNLPRSPKLAADLKQLLRMDIHFREKGPAGRTTPPLPEKLETTLTGGKADGRLIALSDGREAVIYPLDETHDMIFLNRPQEATLSPWHPATRVALLAFWLFSAFFAWIIGQQVVRPVSRLTRRLPGFLSRSGDDLPETRRQDELGELARTLVQARQDLYTERALREQSERLALLGRVATGLAHEIKNPLASIQLHAQLMDHEAMDAESQTSLQHLLAEVRVIEGLVNQWLYLARPAPPKKQPVHLAELLEETLQMLRPQARHADVEIVFSAAAASGLPPLPGDRARLQQVFRNLIINAIQAMPTGGRLVIEVAEQGSGQRLTFRDHGSGFSEHALAHGNELFFSEKEGGMGVGLHVAREIVSAHGGEISLKNHPDSGAIVEIALPMGNS